MYIENGYIIKSKYYNILAIENIKLKTMSEMKNIHTKLYVYARGDKYVLFENNEISNIYIEEINGYTEKLRNDIIDAITNELYLDITFTDENNEIKNYQTKISFVETFSNDKLMYHNYNNENYLNNYIAIKNSNSKYNVEIKPDYNLFVDTSHNKLLIENKLSDLGYTYDEATEEYINTYNNEIITFYDNYFNYYKQENSINYNLTYYIDSQKIDYKIYNKESNIIMKLKYYIKDDLLNCINGDCENYIDYIDYILSIYDRLN